MSRSRRAARARVRAAARQRGKKATPHSNPFTWWQKLLGALAVCGIGAAGYAGEVLGAQLCEVSGACAQTPYARYPFYVGGVVLGGLNFLLLAWGVVWLATKRKVPTERATWKLALAALAGATLGPVAYTGIVAGVLVGLDEVAPEVVMVLVTLALSPAGLLLPARRFLRAYRLRKRDARQPSSPS